MIDLGRLRVAPETYRANILSKDPSFDIAKLCELDAVMRALKSDVETLRHKKNELAAAAKKGLTEAVRVASKEVGHTLKEKEAQLRVQQQQLEDLWLRCPNILMDDVPVGDKEDNVVVASSGEKPQFNFPIAHHLDLNEEVAWFDLAAGARMTGAQFALYNGNGVKVLYALTQLMLKNNVAHGFTPVMTPELIHAQGLTNAGNLPKFADDVYHIPTDNLYVIPTSEATLTNLHADQILAADNLPLRYTCWSTCFRREAGGYGAQERGLMRVHQFEKVELYTLARPEDAQDEHERMMRCARTLLDRLGLHYRVSLLASRDCSFSSAKTYDIEVWIPSLDRYVEVSSVSNCTDFQARRAKIRYKDAAQKTQLVYTLNGSSLALPRLMIALLENGQQADGSVILPDVLIEQMEKLW